MNTDLNTAAALARDIAEKEAADAYDALSDEILELREEGRGFPVPSPFIQGSKTSVSRIRNST